HPLRASIPTRRSSDLCRRPGSWSSTPCDRLALRHDTDGATPDRGDAPLRIPEQQRAVCGDSLHRSALAAVDADGPATQHVAPARSEEHTSELQSRENL